MLEFAQESVKQKKGSSGMFDVKWFQGKQKGNRGDKFLKGSSALNWVSFMVNVDTKVLQLKCFVTT